MLPLINGTTIPEPGDIICIEESPSHDSASQMEGGDEQKSNPSTKFKGVYKWSRRYPKPFEIIYCERGYLPIPGLPPYKCYC
jgi:hypothetical protein